MADFAERALQDDTANCIECGAALTAREQQRVVDDGLPPLCTVHAAEREASVTQEDEDAV